MDYTAALMVVILTISSCIEYPVAQPSTNRIVPVGELRPSAHEGYNSAFRTFLLTGSRLRDGVMFAISAYYRSHQPVRFQVWRPTNQSSTYRLVWEHRYEAPRVDVRQDIYFYAKNETLCYHFRQDDRVGVFIEKLPAAIPYEFDTEKQTVFSREQVSPTLFRVGEQVAFDPLSLPYDFSVKAWIDTVNDLYVNDASEWVPCPKSTIPDESPSHGATGYTGPTGPAGPKGDRGPVGPPGAPGAGNGSDSSAMMSIIALAWLFLLTIAVVIITVIIIYCLVVKRRQNDKENVDSESVLASSHHNVSSKRNKTLSDTDDSMRFGDLKEETESTYSIHTMKETTPLSKTGPFVYEGPFESKQAESSNPQLFNGQTTADAAATLDVSSPATQY